MGYRSTVTSRVIAATPEKIWPYLADPRRLSQLGDHPVDVEPDQDYVGAAGETRVEVHGPECDDDRVPCEVVASVHPTLLRTTALQRGIKQTIQYRLTPVADGTEVEERIVFSVGRAGTFGQGVLPRLLLGTGLLARISVGMNDIFDTLEAELAGDDTAEGRAVQTGEG